MDQKLQRIFLVRIESRRLDHESLHVFVVRAFERERLQRLHVDLRQQRVVHVGDWLRLPAIACFIVSGKTSIRQISFGASIDMLVKKTCRFQPTFVEHAIVGM